MADLVAAHGGVRPVEQGEGDSFVVAFARASDAVACALELQRAPLAPIRLRIGVHTGEVQLRDEGNYAGPTINRTARLRDLGHGGQTLLSGATEPLVVDWLPADAWLTDLGTHQLRELPRPERVAQLCHPDLRNEFPPLRTSKRVDTQPSGPAHQFHRARRADRRGAEAAGRQPARDPHRAGGAGKTRLAVQVAAARGPSSPTASGTSTWRRTDPGGRPGRGGACPRSARPPGRRRHTSSARGRRRMLIVLDNCEHLLDAARPETALLEPAPG